MFYEVLEHAGFYLHVSVKIAARPNSNLIWIGDIDGNKLPAGDLLDVNCRLRFRNWTGRKNRK